jgi:hypothetical protein
MFDPEQGGTDEEARGSSRLTAVGLAAAGGSTGSGDAPTEVWAIDQSNTTGTTSGGAIHI